MDGWVGSSWAAAPLCPTNCSHPGHSNCPLCPLSAAPTQDHCPATQSAQVSGRGASGRVSPPSLFLGSLQTTLPLHAQIQPSPGPTTEIGQRKGEGQGAARNLQGLMGAGSGCTRVAQAVGTLGAGRESGTPPTSVAATAALGLIGVAGQHSVG